MKKMIALTTMLMTTAVGAQELQFGDVNYFIKEEQINVRADINQTFHDETNKAGTEVITRSILTQGYLAYGLTDHFNLTLSTAYAYDNQSSDQTVGTHKADIYSDGFTNPSLGANYRLLNQGTSGVNFDLGAIASIKVQEAKVGASINGRQRSGNSAFGRDSLELNARVGKKWDVANEWQLAAGVKYFRDGETTIKKMSGSDDTRKEDSSFDSYLRATYQYRPVHEFMMLVSLQASQTGKVDGKFDNTGDKYKAGSHLDLGFHFMAKCLVTDNVIGYFSYAQYRNEDFNVRTGSTQDEARKRRDNNFGLGVDLLF